MKNHGADELVNEMFDMGEETMSLPFEEKIRFEQGDDGMSFGYAATLLSNYRLESYSHIADTRLRGRMPWTRLARSTLWSSSISRRTTRWRGPGPFTARTLRR